MVLTVRLAGHVEVILLVLRMGLKERLQELVLHVVHEDATEQ